MQCADDICRSAQRRLETESRGDLRELVDGMYESAQTILLCAGHQQRIVDDILVSRMRNIGFQVLVNTNLDYRHSRNLSRRC